VTAQLDLFAEPAVAAPPELIEDLTHLTIRPADVAPEDWERATLRRYLEWLLNVVNRRGLYAESCKAYIPGLLQRMGGLGGTW
jgi:hypothetical protein